MLDDRIKNEEKLYKAVPNKPQMWKPKENRPSSAIYKDSKGVSVDRDGEREEVEIIGNLRERFPDAKAVVYITAENCRNKNAFLKYDPIPATDDAPANPYHSLILNSENEGDVTLRGKKPTHLAKLTITVFDRDK